MVNGGEARRTQLAVHIDGGALDFSIMSHRTRRRLVCRPCAMGDNMSVTTGLQRTFNRDRLLRHNCRGIHICVSAPVLLMPVRRFRRRSLAILCRRTFANDRDSTVLCEIRPGLGIITIFPVGGSLGVIVRSGFRSIHFAPVVRPV